MLYKIRCNLKHPLCGALPVPYVPVRATSSALIAHRYTFAPPRCRTLQYRRTFILLSVSLWNDLVDPLFDGVGLGCFKSRSNAFLLAKLLSPFLSTVFPFYSFPLWVGGVGLGSSDWWGINLPLPALHCQSFLIIMIISQQEVKFSTMSMGCANNQLISIGDCCKVKGCNSMIDRGSRTQPILMMAVQITHNRKEAWTSSACTAAIDARKQSKIRWARSGLR